MEDHIVGALAANAFARLEDAKRELLARMDAEGFKKAAGWRLSEELRHIAEGTEWIFRPIHRTEPCPSFYIRVLIDHSGRLVETGM